MRQIFSQIPRFDVTLAVSLGLTILGFIVYATLAE
jgi:hypothetical protein